MTGPIRNDPSAATGCGALRNGQVASKLSAANSPLGDVVALAPMFESGVLVGPGCLPPWARDLRTLASVLAYSVFATRIDLSEVRLSDFANLEPDREGDRDLGVRPGG